MKYLRKSFIFILILSLIMSSFMIAAAKSEKAVTKGSTPEGKGEKIKTEDTDEPENDNDLDETESEEGSDEKQNKKGKAEGKEKSSEIKLTNQFKKELIQQKKEITGQKTELQKQKEQLLEEYNSLMEAGDTEGAAAIQQQIEELDSEIAVLKSEIKKIMSERFMVAKNDYSAEELAQFENAGQLIEKMYQDINVLPLGSIVYKKNIIKFDTPPYIRGGRTVIPLRAITEGMGAEVQWNETDRTVIIRKGENMEIVMTIGSPEVSVTTGEQGPEIVVIDSYPAITNNRTYVPLRFIAETFGLNVEWDEETETIDIDQEEDQQEPEENEDLTANNEESTEPETELDEEPDPEQIE